MTIVSVSPGIRYFFHSLVAMTLGLALASLSGCGQKETAGAGAPKGKNKKGGGPAPVMVGKVVRKVVPLEIDAIGVVEPIRGATIRSQVTGVVQHIAIHEGQDIREGETLIEIDPRPLRNALDSAKADNQRIRVQLEYAKGQVARYQTLSTDSMVSKEQFQKIQDDARTLEAQLQISLAAIKNAELQLEYSAIRAPISGRSGNINVKEGDLVRVNDTGAPIITINQLSPIYVTFGVPQQYLSAINRYRSEGKLAVRVVPAGLNEAPELGELTFIDNTVDTTTGTIKLKGTFLNESHHLWPGQFGTVSMVLANPEVLSVPSGAVQTSQSGQHVFVVKADKTAEKRDVVVERIHGADAVVIKGLAEGETVVTEGQLRVLPGGPLEIRNPEGGVAEGGSGKAKGKGKGKGKEKDKETDKAKKSDS